MRGTVNIHRFISPLLVAGALAGASATSHAATLVSEGFDDALLPGWAIVNNSTPGGSTGWFLGNPAIFPAAAGAPESYAAANFNGAPAGGAISNWLMLPVVPLDQATTLEFALRLLGDDVLGLVDTVEVYLSTSGSSTDVGTTTASTGVFSLLQAFSSAADTGWVNETINIGAFASGTTGRVAFRYVVSDTNLAGNYIGIDSVNLGTVPEPTPAALVALALAGLALRRRR